MKYYIFFLSFLSCGFCFAQRPVYDSLVVLAERALSNSDYATSSKLYQSAFKSLKYKGLAPDRFKAAKAMAMSGEIDSAFVYLNILWKKTEYLEFDSLRNERLLISLHKDLRWMKLLDEAKPKMPELAKRLAEIRESDQNGRNQVKVVLAKYGKESREYKELWSAINLQDSLNQREIFDIIDKFGWLGRNDVGNAGSSAIYLVIQHSPIEAQEKYLPLMRDAVKAGKARRQNMAYLEDRVLVRRGKKQLYGSQFKGVDGGYFPIIDIEHLNERREFVGLAPFTIEEMKEVRRQSLEWK